MKARKKSSYSNRYLQTKERYPSINDVGLCDECLILGYCKKYPPAHIQKSNGFALSTKANPPFDLRYYTAKIPFRVNAKEVFNQYAKEHLQTAYDAFHQDDFETALLHFKSVEPGGSFYTQSNYFLALTYFMLKNYEMAVIHMQACVDGAFYKTEDFDSFLDECSQLSIVGSTKEEGIILQINTSLIND